MKIGDAVQVRKPVFREGEKWFDATVIAVERDGISVQYSNHERETIPTLGNFIRKKPREIR